VYAASYSMVAVPYFFGYRKLIAIESPIIILISTILVLACTKILVSRRNYLSLLIASLLIAGYSLKLAYLELLLSTAKENVSADVVIKTMFDTFQVGYLDYNSQNYGLYVSYYTALLIGTLCASLVLPSPDYAQLKALFKPKSNLSRYKSASFILLFCVAGAGGLIVLNSVSFGISSGAASNIIRLPYKIDTIIFLLIRYGLTLVGALKYIEICNIQPPNKYQLAIATKFLILAYLIVFSLYSTSKEYLFVAIAVVVYDIYNQFSSARKRGRRHILAILRMVLSLILVLTTSLAVFSVNTASRFIRNGICFECSGIESSTYAIAALMDGNNAKLQKFLGNEMSLDISSIDKIAISTIFRVQGADNLLQIINKNHTQNTFPDLLGPMAMLTGQREAAHEFYYYRILPYSRIGVNLAVAFPPSLVGLSLQESKNIVNPVVFGVAVYSIYALLIYNLLNLNARIPKLMAIIMTYESLKTFSEGTLSHQLLYTALLIAVFCKIFSLSMTTREHA